MQLDQLFISLNVEGLGGASATIGCEFRSTTYKVATNQSPDNVRKDISWRSPAGSTLIDCELARGSNEYDAGATSTFGNGGFLKRQGTEGARPRARSEVGRVPQRGMAQAHPEHLVVVEGIHGSSRRKCEAAYAFRDSRQFDFLHGFGIESGINTRRP